MIRRDRYTDLKKYLGMKLSNRQLDELDECINFWENMVNSDNEKNVIKRVEIILSEYRKGNFRRFFNGTKGMIRELAAAIAGK
jgi:hypothetical protein